jgi:arsenate reductase-like glutaredoxin family protein
VRQLDPDIKQRDYAKKPLTSAEIGGLVKLAGGVVPLLSTRNAIVKERGWNVEPPDAKAFIEAAAADNNLLRRPIVVVGKRVIVGKDEAAWKDALGH